MAALPASFLNPGTSLGVSRIITRSGDQFRAEVYIGQKAVLAVTGTGGDVASVAALDSLAGLVDWEQPAKSSTATAIALTAHSLSAGLIGVLHLPPFELLCG
jgi:hypothetical protein